VPQLAWRHVIVNTRNSWLHGDPRGFRDRDHRIHSSGDYKHPTPEGEHAGLHAWYKARAGKKVAFGGRLWPIIGECFQLKMQELDRRMLAIAVGSVHVHLVTELPIRLVDCKFEIGLCKRRATEAVKIWHRGRLWAQGGTFKLICDKEHLANAVNYVVTKQKPAWIWNYRDGARFV